MRRTGRQALSHRPSPSRPFHPHSPGRGQDSTLIRANFTYCRNFLHHVAAFIAIHFNNLLFYKTCSHLLCGCFTVRFSDFSVVIRKLWQPLTCNPYSSPYRRTHRTIQYTTVNSTHPAAVNYQLSFQIWETHSTINCSFNTIIVSKRYPQSLGLMSLHSLHHLWFHDLLIELWLQ